MLDLAPLLTAGPAVQIHVIAALSGVVLAPLALFRRRRDRLHKVAGYAWVTSMVVAATASFWIMDIRLIGPFSPIHALSVLVLVNMVLGVQAIRRRDLHKHQAIMRQTAFWGLVVAGGFTFLPGRKMHAVVFGADPEPGSTVLAIAIIAIVVIAMAYVIFGSARSNRLVSAE